MPPIPSWESFLYVPQTQPNHALKTTARAPGSTGRLPAFELWVFHRSVLAWSFGDFMSRNPFGVLTR